jgi:hypothetical protein
MGDVLAFRDRAEGWNRVAALAWYGWQSFGRGIVVMDIKPSGSRELSYRAKGSPDIQHIWGNEDESELEGIDRLIEEYDPHEGFVLLIAYSGAGDEVRSVFPNPDAPSFLKPPDAFK